MDSIEQIAFQIIGLVGDASSMMFESLKFARNNKFEEANELMQKASIILSEAHKAQTDMIVEESRGNKSQYSILMVHAQDHLMNAMLTKPLVTEMIFLYKKLDSKGDK